MKGAFRFVWFVLAVGFRPVPPDEFHGRRFRVRPIWGLIQPPAPRGVCGDHDAPPFTERTRAITAERMGAGSAGHAHSTSESALNPTA